MYNKKERKEFKNVNLKKDSNPKNDEQRISNEIKKLAFSKDKDKYKKMIQLLDESLNKGYITQKQYNKHLEMLKFSSGGVDEIKDKASIMYKGISKSLKSKIDKIKGMNKNDK